MGETARKERAPRAPRAPRLYQRRWCRPCRDCGSVIVFLDETRPPIKGKPRPKWVMVDIFGVRDGVPMPWDGAVAFNTALHVEHSCFARRQKLAWIIRQAEDDI